VFNRLIVAYLPDLQLMTKALPTVDGDPERTNRRKGKPSGSTGRDHEVKETSYESQNS
jgi:hypothetical protein